LLELLFGDGALHKVTGHHQGFGKLLLSVDGLLQ
jgi:hypothetical protein